jgi:uncharacterized 2Fe-2S/4Fe-4S cluster protein (DUF4445 family)
LKSSDRFAIAFDIGTTTIAATLLDRQWGVRLAATGALNPQREFGADVVSRLEAALRSPENLRMQSQLVNRELERLTGELLTTAGLLPDEIGEIAIAGNPAMEHLLLGLDVESLAFPPYRPLFTAGSRIRTTELGWELGLNAYLFPLPGGFVGGDLVAFLYAALCPSSMTTCPSCLYLDLGTNGEMAINARDVIYATSAAAGPAFEGGNLSCGMAALPGAITDVTVAADRLVLTTVGDVTPAGICGSGVLAAIETLLRAGVLDYTGRLCEPGEISSNLANRIRKVGGEPAFVLYQDAQRLVYLSQDDIRQVQLAKGAVRAGVEVLLERSGIHHDALQDVVLTGSFGAELRPGTLKNIGIFTEKMVEISRFVRDGALAGVEKALRDPDGFAAVDNLARAIRVIPLSGTPTFEKHFLAQMNFPKSTNPTRDEG